MLLQNKCQEYLTTDFRIYEKEPEGVSPWTAPY